VFFAFGLESAEFEADNIHGEDRGDIQFMACTKRYTAIIYYLGDLITQFDGHRLVSPELSAEQSEDHTPLTDRTCPAAVARESELQAHLRLNTVHPWQIRP
jgi:hypothetical protein